MENLWKNDFQARLINVYGVEKGNKYYQLYHAALPASYYDKNSFDTFLADISRLDSLSHDYDLEVDFKTLDDYNGSKSLRLYQPGTPIALSDILPILENLGLRTLYEDSYEITRSDNKNFAIIDFRITYTTNADYDQSEMKKIFEQAARAIILQSAENDGFNKLILHGCIPIHEIKILRAYAKYLAQIKYRYNQTFIEKTLEEHVAITKNLLALFKAIHAPYFHRVANEQNNAVAIEASIIKQLEDVKNIGEDSVIRRLMLLIKATLRTNYFQRTPQNTHKEYITLKINSQEIPDLPLPKPLIDTFVFSPYFEAIHLRSHKVSRGGIRWSDRHDDYRTEILGLMKAQKVKNSVIIPSGAKGGFVIKEAAIKHFHGDVKKAIIMCYQNFIRGLLDVTDNFKDNQVIQPNDVVCHDGDDTYFVVAADKGTADLSDYANCISKEYAFWLGDAFASGGSNGYDHKKLGITARGAWESLNRSLQELNLTNTDITMAGIGDMSGDVFGNGLIYSKQIKLVAAFDHRHIFLDPTPDAATSYEERLRMFQLKSSSWDDYNKALISQGGGVYLRSAKLIKLTPQVKQALAVAADELTPDQLVCAILKAPVDVLYNGGIGTYVKASHETSENVGDKTNEFCRVNGNELRCKIVCEGGNLGFTQLARVEYALNGGCINTDFIDNSAGVDCSDHEVNIKILLNHAVEAGQIDEQQRNVILAEMEQEVSQLVLKDNYYQALVMSYSSLHSHDYSDLYIDHIKRLEAVSNLDRSIEYIPTNDELINRKSSGSGLTKPELAILLAYTKIYVKDEIIKSDLPDNEFFNSSLSSIFPTRLRTEFSANINNHILRKEIISTYLSNQILNTMGVTFPFRLQYETGAAISRIAMAQSISAQVFSTDDMFHTVLSLDNKIPVKFQYELLHTIRQLLNMSTRWFIRNTKLETNLNEIVDNYRDSINTLREIIPTLIVGSTRNLVTKMAGQFIQAGLSDKMAEHIAVSRVMYNALNIIAVASSHGFDLVKTAKLYFKIGAVYNLVWFRDTLASDNRHGSTSNLARLTLRDDLDAIQRRLTIAIMQSDIAQSDVTTLINNWIDSNTIAFERWNTSFKSLIERQSDDYTVYFIALRELSAMIEDTNKSEHVSLLAYHDALTKIPNRFAITDRIEQLKKRAENENSKFAIHFIDIDQFKEINDTYGHEAGDKILIELTKRLLSSIRSGDTIARHGGDEFVLIQSDVTGVNDAKLMANKILTKIREPLYLGNHRLNISVSIGIAIYPAHGSNTMELLSNADKAMYESKLNGRSQVSVHNNVKTMA